MDNGERIDAALAGPRERFARLHLIERHEDLAVDADPFIDLKHLLAEHRWQDNVPCEDGGPGLVADPERVPETPCNGKRNALALALKKGIRGNGGTHAHLGDLTALVSEDARNRLEGCVLVLGTILGKQLLDPDASCRRACDVIGESTAAVDCKDPAGFHRLASKAFAASTAPPKKPAWLFW